MDQPDGLRHVAQLIQLAVAPVFLLMASAHTLSVLTGRLSRIVDRARAVEAAAGPMKAELKSLARRAALIYRAMVLAVAAAVCVSTLITVVFASQLVHMDAGRLMAGLFLAALFCYTGALLCLLREVFLAIGSFRVGLGAK